MHFLWLHGIRASKNSRLDESFSETLLSLWAALRSFCSQVSITPSLAWAAASLGSWPNTLQRWLEAALASPEVNGPKQEATIFGINNNPPNYHPRVRKFSLTSMRPTALCKVCRRHCPTFGQQYVHIEKMPSGVSAVCPHQSTTNYERLPKLLIVAWNRMGDHSVWQTGATELMQPITDQLLGFVLQW